jgi:hypothetical protein
MDVKPLEMYKALVDEVATQYRNSVLNEKMSVVLNGAEGILTRSDFLELKDYSKRMGYTGK